MVTYTLLHSRIYSSNEKRQSSIRVLRTFSNLSEAEETLQKVAQVEIDTYYRCGYTETSNRDEISQQYFTFLIERDPDGKGIEILHQTETNRYSLKCS